MTENRLESKLHIPASCSPPHPLLFARATVQASPSAPKMTTESYVEGTAQRGETRSAPTIQMPSPPALLTPLPPIAHSPSTSNRFGLSLGFIQRRPRGLSANGRANRPTSPPDAGSPHHEMPPSPLAEGGSSRGYGFPNLVRQFKRPGSSGNGANTQDGAGSGGGGFGRPSLRRSASQPRTPVSELASSGSSRNLRPHTATGGAATSPLHHPNSAFSPLTPSSSLPSDAFATSSLTVPSPSPTAEPQHLRLVPHLESNRSLHFDPVDRNLAPFAVVSVGRFTDRAAPPSAISSPTDPTKVAFKSKVVSRGHADIWTDDFGKFFIKDTKSSSGTFLNHIRLSGPGLESKAFPLKDGDILQLGVDYQGGTEEIYRCVKMRVELNREWQRKKSSFNTNALKQLRELGGTPPAPVKAEASTSKTTVQARKSSVTDCCICLYPVTVCQALFIAPCSHVTHFACIRPLINKTYPGHTCPVCRTYADLEADVTIDEESEVEDEVAVEDSSPSPDEPISLLPEASLSSLDVTGPEGESVPLSIASHRAGSRPTSIRSFKSARAGGLRMTGVDIEDLAALELAEEVPESSATRGSMAISIPPSALPSLDDSLFSATTPSNTIFLSTLADRFPPSMLSSTPVDDTPNDGGSTSTSALAASPSTQRRGLSSGSEDETDGTIESGTLSNRKGKGREVPRAESVVKESTRDWGRTESEQGGSVLS